MSVFGIRQYADLNSLPSYAAVDTNFLAGAFLDGDALKLQALQAFEDAGTVLMVSTKVIDELGHVTQKYGEMAYAQADAQSGVAVQTTKLGSYLASDEYARCTLADTLDGMHATLRMEPYMIEETKLIDHQFSVNLLRTYGIRNADAQIFSTALRNGVIDLVSDDSDFQLIPTINQWTTRYKLWSNAPPDQARFVFDAADWTPITPAGYFDEY